ncbi:MAG: prepilin-type N-terminal cleavage/methylation domain-containing protein [Planctomycetota bacterium]
MSAPLALQTGPPRWSSTPSTGLCKSSLKRSARVGFSLIEIIVAMAICLLGLAAILQISNLSQSFARKAAEAAELQILAQNRINEVLAGIVPLESVGDGVCPENTEVGYSLSIEPHEQLPLVLLEVSVRPLARDRESSPSPNPQTETAGARRREQREREVTLRRWLALPSQEASDFRSNSKANESVVPSLPSLPPPSSAEEDGNQ